MLFSSYIFFVFIFTFLISWSALPRHRVQVANAASIIFYGSWNPAFVFLLLYSALVDYYCSQKIEKTIFKKQLYLSISIISNLSVLGLFKYFSFFNEITSSALSLSGSTYDPFILNIILPVGISFYTFQTMGYTIDVYRGEIEACRNFNEYFFFVSFFPQLISGPIERSANILPQISSIAAGGGLTSDMGGGAMLIFRGAIKKYVIADNLAFYVDYVYQDFNRFSWQSIGVATVFFGVQIYCDFSGYTDIARGIGRLIGIRLMENFNYPYVATSVREFWRRWHISLSTWLRDYLYRPLGGSRSGPRRTMTAIMITMVLGGVWHGAAYNFVLWGAYHGALLVLQRWWQGWRPQALRMPDLMGWAVTMIAVWFGWFLFRIESIEGIPILYDKIIVANSGAHHIPDLMAIVVFCLFWAVTIVEWGLLKKRFDIATLAMAWKAPAYAVAFLVVYFLAPAGDRTFIYFQF